MLLFLIFLLINIVDSRGTTERSDDGSLLIEWNINPPFVKYFKSKSTKQVLSSDIVSYSFNDESIEFNIETYYYKPIKRYIFVLKTTVFTPWIEIINADVMLMIDQLNIKQLYESMIFDHKDPNNPQTNYRSKFVAFPTKQSFYDNFLQLKQDYLSIKCRIWINGVDTHDSKNIFYLQSVPYNVKFPITNPEQYSPGFLLPEFHVKMDVAGEPKDLNEQEQEKWDFYKTYKNSFNDAMKKVKFIISGIISKSKFELHINGKIGNANITKVEAKYSFFIPEFHFVSMWSVFNVEFSETEGFRSVLPKNDLKVLRKRYNKFVKEFGKSNVEFTVECGIVVTDIKYADTVDLSGLDQWINDYRVKHEL